MSLGHAVRGAATAGLALIALQAVGTDRTGKVGSFFADVNGLLAHALSPDVPLIPDRRTGAGAGDPNDPTQRQPLTAAQAKAAADTARNLPAVNAVIAATGGPSLAQYVAGGGLAGLGANPALQGSPPLAGTGLFPTAPTHTPGQ